MSESILTRLATWATEAPHEVAIRYKRAGKLYEVTSEGYLAQVRRVGQLLVTLGVEPGQVVPIFSYNCPEWVYSDLGAQLIGAQSAGLYPNASRRELDYILSVCTPTVLCVQNLEYVERLRGEEGALTLPEGLRHLLSFEALSSEAQPVRAELARLNVQLHELPSALEALTPPDEALSSRLDPAQIDPGQAAFIIFTSGTTGQPKGAMLSHSNLTITADVAIKNWSLPFGGLETLSFLPLCHIAEKMQNLGIGISLRYTVNYCVSFEQLSEELVSYQPSVLLSVPRLWEKMMEGALGAVSRLSGFKRALARWALACGARLHPKQLFGEGLSSVERLQLSLAERLVLAPMRIKMGLGKVALAGSGAAALSARVAEFFWGLGIEIREVYGQTESTGIITFTRVGERASGTVGRPLPEFEFKLCEDGEVACRGENVFLGYFKQETSCVDEEGWLYTGDLGALTEDGLLKIIGRKKEIMKTSGGKMTAPVPIEEELKAHPLVSQACLVGDGERYFCALLTPAERYQLDPAWVTDGVVTDPVLLKELEEHVALVNSRFARFEQVKYFKVLAQDFSIEADELTPTLKLKRAKITARHRELIASMY